MRLAELRRVEGATFAELVATIRAAPSSGMRRALVVHVARLRREVVTDAELGTLAEMFPGKVATYLAAALIVRRLRRGDPTAIADALASSHAFVQVALLAHGSPAQLDELARVGKTRAIRERARGRRVV